MNLSDKPQLIPLAWATDAPSGERNVIPTTSTTPGVASLQYGFPEQCFLPDDEGGLPPAGADFNGVLNLTTGAARYAQAGGFYQYDAAFSAAIGGYPKGAVLLSADGTFYWKNSVDANTTSPDASPAGAGWFCAGGPRFEVQVLPNLTSRGPYATPPFDPQTARFYANGSLLLSAMYTYTRGSFALAVSVDPTLYDNIIGEG